MRQCVTREIREETGQDSVVGAYLGGIEYCWGEPTEFEINHYFEIDSFPIGRHAAVPSLASHLEFVWVHADELDSWHLRPQSVVEFLRGWERGGGKAWWASFA